ncbi:DUF4307 domain-containing protein [Cellulomonas sp. C5510]|uniref:DUF4307 domain-containing protein n=1 Tax=Cellulomonas sp. C5510 TaxID=2871170 RepID=UPI0021045F14|nr:DUF4307 domain-containing protein [Cellulomonas sp. C5510]
MTADAAATPVPPEGRYGRPPTPRGRRATRAAVAVLAVVGVALVVWLGVGQARTPVRWDEVGFRVDGPTATELTFDVTKAPGTTAVCQVQALSERYAEVGVRTVEVGPAGTRTQRVTTTIPTAEQAVSAVVESCEPA